MSRMSSYQRRKREIAYLSQIEDELRELCLLLAELIKTDVKLPLSRGIAADDFITPYNCGEFDLKLLSRQANANA